ncbi:16S rRNA (cytosine(1402)-N(4))-methyltransferase RsmH [Cytophagales bacterium LB-30]|uniref:Ribosomal RNA small subunit methyltransferase H n=1 Tax=Shiella aurantiaca TaxID=3058365 RepID=A0ABT8F1Z3_9BACT|nr:16S rRNA (cytosine(1402)-N(4))-methyltransferase RsmH [Shiella aurantiaca]MDN4164432.1 16S rRNA (cytosine(1402)-N(4))-methyltransferase RsmH [Shiella aurantiaca]
MYHIPVMLTECLDGLQIQPHGVYVDVTFGGGGHSKAILAQLTTGKLFAFDQDDDAEKNAEAISHPGFQFIKANFRDMKRYLKLYGATAVNGILADLGVSSHQFDIPDRGFSTRFDAELDMRMDQNAPLSAKQVINEWSEGDLHKILGMYGEVTNAKTVAAAITAARINQPIDTVNQLKSVLNKYAPRGKENKYYAQVFQAIRIVVNDEMKVLEEWLPQTAEVLAPGGRLVVMSYHSLEDRLVKNYINNGKLFGEAEKDFYGNLIRPLKPISRKPIEASKEELERNSRARSAKLRIAEKI